MKPELISFILNEADMQRRAKVLAELAQHKASDSYIYAVGLDDLLNRGFMCPESVEHWARIKHMLCAARFVKAQFEQEQICPKKNHEKSS